MLNCWFARTLFNGPGKARGCTRSGPSARSSTPGQTSGRPSSVMRLHGRISIGCFRDRFRIPGVVSRFRPNGVGWLKPRLRDVNISTGLAVISANARGDQVDLKLSDGSHELVDHVLMATGYRVDVRKYEFLSASLVSALRLIGGLPVLGRGLNPQFPGCTF